MRRPVIEYKISPDIGDPALNRLFSASWPNHRDTEFRSTHRCSMAYVCAYQGQQLVGYVNAAWDGKTHVFVLDTTVHPDARRQGIGRELVLRVLEQARLRGASWVHVDYEPQLREFYGRCGFRTSEAGVISLAGAG